MQSLAAQIAVLQEQLNAIETAARAERARIQSLQHDSDTLRAAAAAVRAVHLEISTGARVVRRQHALLTAVYTACGKTASLSTAAPSPAERARAQQSAYRRQIEDHLEKWQPFNPSAEKAECDRLSTAIATSESKLQGLCQTLRKGKQQVQELANRVRQGSDAVTAAASRLTALQTAGADANHAVQQAERAATLAKQALDDLEAQETEAEYVEAEIALIQADVDRLGDATARLLQDQQVKAAPAWMPLRNTSHCRGVADMRGECAPTPTAAAPTPANYIVEEPDDEALPCNATPRTDSVEPQPCPAINLPSVQLGAAQEGMKVTVTQTMRRGSGGSFMNVREMTQTKLHTSGAKVHSTIRVSEQRVRGRGPKATASHNSSRNAGAERQAVVQAFDTREPLDGATFHAHRPPPPFGAQRPAHGGFAHPGSQSAHGIHHASAPAPANPPPHASNPAPLPMRHGGPTWPRTQEPGPPARQASWMQQRAQPPLPGNAAVGPGEAHLAARPATMSGPQACSTPAYMSAASPLHPLAYRADALSRDARLFVPAGAQQSTTLWPEATNPTRTPHAPFTAVLDPQMPSRAAESVGNRAAGARLPGSSHAKVPMHPPPVPAASKPCQAGGATNGGQRLAPAASKCSRANNATQQGADEIFSVIKPAARLGAAAPPPHPPSSEAQLAPAGACGGAATTPAGAGQRKVGAKRQGSTPSKAGKQADGKARRQSGVKRKKPDRTEEQQFDEFGCLI